MDFHKINKYIQTHNGGSVDFYYKEYTTHIDIYYRIFNHLLIVDGFEAFKLYNHLEFIEAGEGVNTLAVMRYHK